MEWGLPEAVSADVVHIAVAVPVAGLKVTPWVVQSMPLMAEPPSRKVTVPAIDSTLAVPTKSVVTFGVTVAVKLTEPSTVDVCDAGVTEIAVAAFPTGSVKAGVLAELGL
jgi:hypothetical protein